MAKLTNAQLKEIIEKQQAQIDALKADRQVSETMALTTDNNGMKIISTANGQTVMELFETALDSRAFVTYKAVSEALGFDKWSWDAKQATMDFIVEKEVDYLVVNKKGEYGARAPVEAHYNKLRSMGYEMMPKQAVKKAKKKKAEAPAAGLSPEVKAQLIAALLQ